MAGIDTVVGLYNKAKSKSEYVPGSHLPSYIRVGPTQYTSEWVIT